MRETQQENKNQKRKEKKNKAASELTANQTKHNTATDSSYQPGALFPPSLVSGKG